MPYIVTNATAADIAFRDDAGKHIIAKGDSLVMDGNQHASAAEAAGLTVEWKQTLDEAPKPDDKPDDDKPVEDKSKRKATVTARD